MVWVLIGASAEAASVYVSPGDDLSAVTSSLLPGDVVRFSAGVYELDGTVYWTGLGAPDASIEFAAEEGAEVILRNNGGGSVATITGSSFIWLHDLIFQGGGDVEYNRPGGLRIEESSDVVIENVTVRDVGDTGIRIDGNTSRLTIRHNEIMNTGEGSGIYVGCGGAECWMQDSLIDANLIHDVGGAGIVFTDGTQGSTIANNVIFRTGYEGLSVLSTAFGPQNVVMGNAIWQTGDQGVYIEGSALVQNNLIFETGDEGIETNNGYGEESLYNVQISHNTIARTGSWGASFDEWFDRDDMVFANNAITNPTGLGLYWEDPSFDDYGYTTGTGTVPETSNYISGNVVTGYVDGFDQQVRVGFVVQGGGVLDFEDVDNYDFRPTSNSTLRSAGDANGAAYIPAEDFDGTARNGANPTVGAYEFGAAGWVVQEDFKGFGAEAPPVQRAPGGCCGAKEEEGGGTAALTLLPLLAFGWVKRRARAT
jgi:hypothetical protein